jgi:hypothetical protein
MVQNHLRNLNQLESSTSTEEKANDACNSVVNNCNSGTGTTSSLINSTLLTLEVTEGT